MRGVEEDAVFLARAVKLAVRSFGHVRPNPAVGAVIVKGGRVIGEGRHRRCGGDHAEVAALKNCKVSPRGATIYCTLEPCSRPGRVGACTDALIAAGIKRVVWAIADPNPVNRGRAARILRKAGIIAECFERKREIAIREVVELARELIVDFRKHVRTGIPYVTVKIAMSLDGRICDDQGSSRWISGSCARAFTGMLREHVDVVMVGAETIRKDNPSLLSHRKRNDDLWRAIISRSGRLPKQAQVFVDEAKDRTLVYRDAREALKDLGRRGFCHVLCEGGLELARSLVAEGLVDEWIMVLAPIVIGHGPLVKAVRGKFSKKDATFLRDDFTVGVDF